MFDAKTCSYPWIEMQLNYDGTYGLCCFHVPFKRGTDNLNELWNSDKTMAFRDNIKNYDTKDSICHTCAMHRMDMSCPQFDDFIYSGRQDLAGMNVIAAKEEFEKRKLSLSSRPLRLYINFGLECNLACKMCSQMTLRRQHPEVFDAGVLYTQIDFLSHVSEIIIIGGEPFVLKPALDFMKFAAKHDVLKKIKYRITTNGTLINSHLGLLSEFDNLSLSFSIDSYGKYYEDIRIGANWEKVRANVEIYDELAKTRPGWDRVNICCVLMLSGLPGLYDLCKWCVENEYNLGFGRVFDDADPKIIKENIFEHRDSLGGCPGWMDIFKKCIKLLFISGYDAAAGQLFNYFYMISSGQSEAEKYRIQRDMLVASRWRKLGLSLGIVKRQSFE